MKHFKFSDQDFSDYGIENIKKAGVDELFISPGFCWPDTFMDNGAYKIKLRELIEKAKLTPEITVNILGTTTAPAEGVGTIPERYRKQVDVDGKYNPVHYQVCFQDTERQKDLLERYRMLAELGFSKVLIDDDFCDVYCFCDEHLKNFYKETGVRIKRQEVVKAVFAEAPSKRERNLRKLWFGFKRKYLLAFAAKIEKTVHAANKKTRIGICISTPMHLDKSGYCISELIKIYDKPGARAFVRLPNSNYTNQTILTSAFLALGEYYNGIIPKNIERLAETSIGGGFFKDYRHLRLEILANLVFGIKNILLCWGQNLEQVNVWNKLKEENGYLDKVAKLIPVNKTPLGIPVMMAEKTSYANGKIYVDDALGAVSFFGLNGFPVKMADISGIKNEKVAVVTSHTIDNTKIITEYLRKGGSIIIDSKCLDYIQKNKLLDLPVKTAGMLAGYCFEKTHSASTPLIWNIRYGSILKLENTGDSDITKVSSILNSNGKEISLGVTCIPYLKGKIIVLPFGFENTVNVLCTEFHRDIISKILELADYKPVLRLTGDMFVQPYVFKTGRKILTMLVNYNSQESEVGIISSAKGFKDLLTGKKEEKSIKINHIDVKLLKAELR